MGDRLTQPAPRFSRHWQEGSCLELPDRRRLAPSAGAYYGSTRSAVMRLHHSGRRNLLAVTSLCILLFCF